MSSYLCNKLDRSEEQRRRAQASFAICNLFYGLQTMANENTSLGLLVQIGLLLFWTVQSHSVDFSLFFTGSTSTLLSSSPLALAASMASCFFFSVAASSTTWNRKGVDWVFLFTPPVTCASWIGSKCNAAVTCYWLRRPTKWPHQLPS